MGDSESRCEHVVVSVVWLRRGAARRTTTTTAAATIHSSCHAGRDDSRGDAVCRAEMVESLCVLKLAEVKKSRKHLEWIRQWSQLVPVFGIDLRRSASKKPSSQPRSARLTDRTANYSHAR